MDHSRTIRNLVIFASIVLSMGWIGRALDVLMNNPAAEGLGILLWLIAPLGISMLLRAFAGDGLAGFAGKWADQYILLHRPRRRITPGAKEKGGG